jgi:hypothetical protein
MSRGRTLYGVVALMEWNNFPNLRRRPAAPASRGKLQAAIRHAYIAAGCDTLSASEIYDWALVRVRRETHWQRWDRWSVTVAVTWLAFLRDAR